MPADIDHHLIRCPLPPGVNLHRAQDFTRRSAQFPHPVIDACRACFPTEILLHIPCHPAIGKTVKIHIDRCALFVSRGVGPLASRLNLLTVSVKHYHPAAAANLAGYRTFPRFAACNLAIYIYAPFVYDTIPQQN